jgi:aspartate/methionine/tyrosine aminotransferase
MGRLTPKLIERIRELYAEYGSYKRVADELNLDWRTVRKHVHEQDQPTEQPELPASARAFQIFDRGGTPVDVVKEGIAEPEEAEELYKKYRRLKGLPPPISVDEALKQVDQRLKKVEEHEKGLEEFLDAFVEKLDGAKIIVDAENRIMPVLETIASMQKELKTVYENIHVLKTVYYLTPGLVKLIGERYGNKALLEIILGASLG